MRTGAKRVLSLTLAIGLLGGASVASASDGTVRLTADLTGAQEVPLTADPDGFGKAKVDVNVAAGTVCFDIKLDAVGTPNRGHIHEEIAGANGAIVVTFFELRTVDTPATDPRNDEIEQGRIEDCVSADPGLLARIVAEPHKFYVNVHNARFPAGALRCQLEE